MEQQSPSMLSMRTGGGGMRASQQSLISHSAFDWPTVQRQGSPICGRIWLEFLFGKCHVKTGVSLGVSGGTQMEHNDIEIKCGGMKHSKLYICQFGKIILSGGTQLRTCIYIYIYIYIRKIGSCGT